MIWFPAAAQTQHGVQVEIEVAKTRYEVFEPILVHETLTVLDALTLPKWEYVRWDRFRLQAPGQFAIMIGEEGAPPQPIIDGRSPGLGGPGPSLGDYYDPQTIPVEDLKRLGSVQRADLVGVRQSGAFQIVAALKVMDGFVIYSEPVSITVVPSTLPLFEGKAQEMHRQELFGQIYCAYYGPITMSEEVGGASLAELAYTLWKKAPHSPYLEPLMFAVVSKNLYAFASGNRGAAEELGAYWKSFHRLFPDSPYCQALAPIARREEDRLRKIPGLESIPQVMHRLSAAQPPYASVVRKVP